MKRDARLYQPPPNPNDRYHVKVFDTDRNYWVTEADIDADGHVTCVELVDAETHSMAQYAAWLDGGQAIKVRQFLESEQVKDRYIATKTVDNWRGLMMRANLEATSGDPFADPRTERERLEAEEGWEESEDGAGWFKVVAHPFEPGATIVMHRRRI